MDYDFETLLLALRERHRRDLKEALTPFQTERQELHCLVNDLETQLQLPLTEFVEVGRESTADSSLSRILGDSELKYALKSGLANLEPLSLTRASNASNASALTDSVPLVMNATEFSLPAMGATELSLPAINATEFSLSPSRIKNRHEAPLPPGGGDLEPIGYATASRYGAPLSPSGADLEQIVYGTEASPEWPILDHTTLAKDGAPLPPETEDMEGIPATKVLPIFPLLTDPPFEEDGAALPFKGVDPARNLTSHESQLRSPRDKTHIPKDAQVFALQLHRSISELQSNQRRRQQRRFRNLMELKAHETHVQPKHIALALSKKAPPDVTERWNEIKLTELVREMARIKILLKEADTTLESANFQNWRNDYDEKHDAIPLQYFVELIMLPSLASQIQFVYGGIQEIQEALLKEDIMDVMNKITMFKSRPGIVNDGGIQGNKISILNGIVGACVVISLLQLGISLDVEPGSIAWIVIEGAITCVFVCEIIVKTTVFGWKSYLTGKEWHYNVLDVFITSLAIVDFFVSILIYGKDSETGGDVSSSRLVMVARLLRLARVTRLMKALNMPLLRELANMLSGFVIALPTLLWIIFLIFLCLYLVGALFRTMMGPSPRNKWLSKCPPGDEVTYNADDPLCWNKIHYLYGEEYFRNVPTAMFTTFRCTLGDCTTKAGRALAPIFSEGYQTKFIVTYSLGMLAVIFGLFNIINSIFVESVITGLKRNDIQKRYHQLYDAEYVKKKLFNLRERLLLLSTEPCVDEPDGGPLIRHSGHKVNDIFLTEEDYVKILSDEVVSRIFDELDVPQYHREGLFDIFDVDGSGRISEADLMKTLMMLRGEPQRSDFVSSFVLLRNLRDKIHHWQQLLLDNQRLMLDNQEQLLTASRPIARRE